MFGLLRLFKLPEKVWRDNLDTTCRIKVEEIFVAGDDAGALSSNRSCDDGIIIGIPTDGRVEKGDRYDLASRLEQAHRSIRLACGEFELSGELVLELGEYELR